MRIRRLAMMAIYVVGMASFLSVDMLIARIASVETVANWAALKSAVMIGATVSLLGLDQVMVRIPHQATMIFRRLIAQVMLISAAYVSILSLLGIIDGGIQVVSAVFVVAISVAQFGFFRSRFQLFTAQLAINLWKLFFLLFVIFSLYFGYPTRFSSFIVVSIVLAQVIILFTRKYWPEAAKIQGGVDENIRGIYSLGLRFFISLMTLNISIYMEQLMLNSNNQTEASAIYFTHTAIIFPFMIALNGFLGFILGPYIRQNISRFDNQLAKWWWLLPLGALMIGAVAFSISIPLHRLFYATKLSYNYNIAIIVVLIGLMRIIYILPSAYLGVAANKDIFSSFVGVNVFGVVVLIGGYYMLLHFGLNAVYAVSIANLCNWIFRAGYGILMVRKVWFLQTRERDL